MFPGVNPRQINQMMKRMGISQTEIDATEVIIKTKEKILVFEKPEVSKVNMMGQETYQIIGKPVEKNIETMPEINEEDIQTVMQQTSCSEEDAKKAIIESKGDLAEAILKLSKK